MQLVLQVERVGTQFRGSLTRDSDQSHVAFEGVVELITALETLSASEPRPDAGATPGPPMEKRR